MVSSTAVRRSVPAVTRSINAAKAPAARYPVGWPWVSWAHCAASPKACSTPSRASPNGAERITVPHPLEWALIGPGCPNIEGVSNSRWYATPVMQALPGARRAYRNCCRSSQPSYGACSGSRSGPSCSWVSSQRW